MMIKKCVKLLSLLVIGTILLSACSSRKSDSDIELQEGQSLRYAQIVSINGNEATLAWATATSTENITTSENETKGNNKDGRPQSDDRTKNENNDSDNSNASGRGERETEATTVYTLSGEQDTMFIPVGTTVTTELGATTTFSRLAAGDMLKLVVGQNTEGNDAIVAVWIVE